MDSSAQPAPVEGRGSWLAIAAIVLAVFAGGAWIAWGSPSPGPIPGSLSENPVLTLHAGQTSTFRPGRMAVGSLIACTNAGLRVVEGVPARGRVRSTHIDPAIGFVGVTITIVQRHDRSVTARCSH